MENIKHKPVQSKVKIFDQLTFQSLCQGESLYLAVGYIILEIISTFLCLPEMLNKFHRCIKEAQEKALKISRSIYTRGYFDIIDAIINTAKITPSAYYWLNYYAESAEINKFIVDGAKHIILGLTDPEKAYRVQQILSEGNTRSSKHFIFDLIASKLSIKTILYHKIDDEISKDEFCKSKIGGDSYIAFLYEEDENYSILYTEDHINMQKDRDYPYEKKHEYPFFCKMKEYHMKSWQMDHLEEEISIPKRLLIKILEEADSSNILSQDVRNNLSDWIRLNSSAKEIIVAKKISESLPSILNCLICGSDKSFTEFPNYKCFPKCIVCRECRNENPKACRNCQRTYEKNENPE
ncbi:hypothetical protein SteCoe_32856 [Stentor coeruleus]|uniref:Uncharacterized protein n=1 Tax=Stentor coeruleus TaxID=5963 RepID=A0A1R2AY89_9CILI|nr:hypothetical protein SteCoe_32856 [Stentor coeruleus]